MTHMCSKYRERENWFHGNPFIGFLKFTMLGPRTKKYSISFNG